MEKLRNLFSPASWPSWIFWFYKGVDAWSNADFMRGQVSAVKSFLDSGWALLLGFGWLFVIALGGHTKLLSMVGVKGRSGAKLSGPHDTTGGTASPIASELFRQALNNIPNVEATLHPDFVAFLSERMEALHAEYHDNSLVLTRTSQPPMTWDQFLGDRAFTLTAEFAGLQKGRQAAALEAIDADEAFAPTLIQLLTGYAHQAGGAVPLRQDLLAQNAEAIKKTYEEYLRRSAKHQS